MSRPPPLDIVDDRCPRCVALGITDLDAEIEKRLAMLKPDRIPNPKQNYPRPGSPEEEAAIEAFGTDSMTTALFAFGPDNTGAAIAALCCGLGTLYRMLPPVADFYKSPEKFAAACKIMIADTAVDSDGDEDRE